MKRKNPNRRETRLVETEIFHLRKKADLSLQAGDVAEFDRLQSAISHLQAVHGIVKGQGEDEHHGRTA
ncbi:MAG TPA: hypothetical protein VMW54_11910 [Terriglobia bacterium]|nr:hypothetical protein [Terriglobia bacterium]